MSGVDKISVFQELVLGYHGLYSWLYDVGLRLITGNCPEAEIIHQFFMTGSRPQTILEYIALHNKPLLITDDLDMTWIVVVEEEDEQPIRLRVLGPLYTDDTALRSINEKIQKLKTPAVPADTIRRILERIPVISRNQAMEYALMLHYCTSGTWLSISDIHYRSSSDSKQDRPAEVALREIHGTYQLEQEMLNAVREGNLDYNKIVSRLARAGKSGRISNGNPLRQAKNEVLVCTVLFSRAAIEGGLNPEASLSLADYYCQSVETCSDMSELIVLTKTMQEDYIKRVHRCRSGSLSKLASDCREYIELHLDDELTLAGMARRFNYSEGYLSRHFKQEMKTTFRTYVCRKRLEKARELLLYTDRSVQEISESLRFCSQSYFASEFRKLYGLSPTECRERRDADQP